VRFRALAIEGAFEVTPQLHGDDRGLFLEWFKASSFRDAVGHDLTLAQANCSVSSSGVLRGIHFTTVPPGQAKYVTCVAGAVVDVVLDIRVDSPTFGLWDQVVLDDVDRRGVFLEAGLGHGFMSVAPGSAVVYLCSTQYMPQLDHAVDPLDPAIGIEWPRVDRDGNRIDPTLSAKDATAPTLAEAAAAGILPSLADLATQST
jgi:dTDP-4-dehydrorhamnose 3,5-epimerase